MKSLEQRFSDFTAKINIKEQMTDRTINALKQEIQALKQKVHQLENKGESV